MVAPANRLDWELKPRIVVVQEDQPCKSWFVWFVTGVAVGVILGAWTVGR